MNRMQTTRQDYAAIRRILLTEWDPIGVAGIPEARDEYDGYAAGVYQRLAAGATDDEMTAYLLHLETGSMGLRGDPARARASARRLLGLRIFTELDTRKEQP